MTFERTLASLPGSKLILKLLSSCYNGYLVIYQVLFKAVMMSKPMSLLRLVRLKKTVGNYYAICRGRSQSFCLIFVSNNLANETSDCAHLQVVADDLLPGGNDVPVQLGIECNTGPSKSVSDCTDFFISNRCSVTLNKSNQPTSMCTLAATK